MLKKLALFAVCVLFVSGVGLWANAARVAALDAQTGVLKYEAVPNALQLPKGFKFDLVTGVAADKDDNLFVFHRGKQTIAVFDKEGKFLRSWGDGAVKTAHGLRIDPAGNVWTTDLDRHQVVKYDPMGKVLLTLGRRNRPGETQDRFNMPADVAVTPAGDIYVADGYVNSRVVKFNKDGKYLKEWGKKGKGPGEFDLVHAIVLDAKGRVYVGDRENDRIQVFDADGKFIEQWRDTGAPYGLFLQDGKRMLVANGRGDEIRLLDLTGKVLARFGKTGTAAGQFQMPHGICADSRGFIYVGEGDGERLQKFVGK